jgi:hypothetical protein
MNRLGWFVIVLLILTLLLSACGDAGPERAAGLSWTPQAGGMILPSPAPLATPTATTATPENVAAETSVLAVGQTVVAVGEQPLRLQADARNDAPVLEVYPPGATFTVVEPSAAFTRYPVQVDERSWYRLEAADGLVGWAVIDAVVAQPNQ